MTILTTKDEVMHVIRRLPTDDVIRIVNMCAGLVNSRLYTHPPRGGDMYDSRDAMADAFLQGSLYIRNDGKTLP